MRRATTALVLAAVLAAGFGLAVARPQPADATAGFRWRRIAGADRYATAREIALEAFPVGSPEVLLASGENFPDALTGAYLAGVLNAPILLTPTGSLHATTRQAIIDLGASRVTILGGPAAVSANVSNQVAGITTSRGRVGVRRVAGADRFETAAEIAKAGGGAIGRFDGKRTALAAYGLSTDEALAWSPVAFAMKMPILLTVVGDMRPPTRAALAANGIEQILEIGLGGPAPGEEQFGLAGVPVVAIAPAGQYADALHVHPAFTVAEWEVAELGWTPTHVNGATFTRYPDALAGSVHAGKEQTPVVPLDTFSVDALDWFAERAGVLQSGDIFGGPQAVVPAQAYESEARAGRDMNLISLATPGPITRPVGSAVTCTVSAPPGIDEVAVMVTDRRNVAGSGAATQFGTQLFPGPFGAPPFPEGRTISGGAPSPENPAIRVLDLRNGPGTITFSSSTAASLIAVAVETVWGPRFVTAQQRLEFLHPFGAGCAVDLVPEPAAPSQAVTLRVEQLDRATGMIVGRVLEGAGGPGGEAVRVDYSSGDAFALGGASAPTSTRAEFDRFVSIGDDVRITPEPGRSFMLVNDVVEPARLITSRLRRGAQPDTVDVVLEVVAGATNGAGTSYRVDRSIDPNCDVETRGGTASVTLSFAGDLAGAVDAAVPQGCYRYGVVATNEATGATDGTAGTANAVSSRVRAVGDRTGPRSTLAVVAREAGNRAVLERGDAVLVCFSEPVRIGAATPNIRIADGDGTVVAVANQAVTQPGDPACGPDAARSLVIDFVEPLVVVAPGAAAEVRLPARFMDGGGVDDLAGNAWRPALSADLTID